MNVLHDDGDGVLADERRPPREHLVHQDAHGVEIGATIHLVSEGLLRREVARCSTDEPGLGQVHLLFARSNGLGDTEVENLHEIPLAVDVADHDVLGLQVAVYQTQLVSLREALDDLTSDVDHALRGLRALILDELTEGNPG